MIEKFVKGISGYFRRRIDSVPIHQDPNQIEREGLPLGALIPEPITEPVPDSHTELVASSPVTAPEYQEPEPEPVNYYMVVADDVPAYRTSIAQQAELICEPIGSYRVVEVDRLDRLLRQSLMGNAGKPAQAVLLDDSYTNESHRWVPRFSEVQAIAEELGIDLSAYTPPSSKGGFYNPNALSALWNSASSTGYSILLRALGYEGKIVVLSSAPPDAEEIEKQYREIAELVTTHPDRFPIDGVISVNKSHGGTVNYWANERRTQQDMFRGHWESHHRFEDQGQDFSLAGVLQRML